MLICLTLAAINFSNSDSVISSLAFATTSPVSLSMMLLAIARPKIKSCGTAILLTPAFSMSRMCLTVMRLSLATNTSPFLATMSNLATSPRRRSGTKLNSIPLALIWKVSKSKKVAMICSGVYPNAFSKMVTGILRRRSIRKYK